MRKKREIRWNQCIMNTSDGWPVKRMSGDYLAFAFPYGARALMAEREKVQKVLGLTMQMNHGWFPGGNNEPVFKVPLSFQEGFVRNDTERITLMDRVRTYHNFNWKRDVSGKPNMNHGEGGFTQSDGRYATLINTLLELQALTEELKPETLMLMSNCAGEHELQHRLRQRAGDRPDGEHPECDQQQVAPPVAVAQPAVGRHGDGHREQVAERDPARVAQSAEVRGNGRRRGRQQGLVDRSQEHRQHQRREQPQEFAGRYLAVLVRCRRLRIAHRRPLKA